MRSKRLWLAVLIYLLHALVWVTVLPPWQGPDEPGHYEYARLWAELGRPPRRSDTRYALQGKIIRELDRHRFWTRTHQPRPSPLPTRFEENPFLVRSGSQLGNEFPLYYALPALIVRWTSNAEMHLYLARAWSLLLGALIVLAAFWAGPLLWQEERLQQVFPFLVALLPMPTFIHTTFNSTVFADVVGAFFFLSAWQVLRTSSRIRWWGLFLLLTGLAAVVKRTTWPLVPLALWIIYIRPPARLRAYRAILPYALLGAFFLLLLFPSTPSRAAHWTMGKARQPAIRVPVSSHPVNHALFLASEHVGEARAYVAQDLGAGQIQGLRGAFVQFNARIRSLEGTSWVCISVIDRYARSTACQRATPEWHWWRVQHPVHPLTPFVRVVVGLGNPHTTSERGRILIDDLSLMPETTAENALQNGQVEIPLSRWQHLLDTVGWRVGDSSNLKPALLARRLFWATAILFTSFWGNFGWLQYPLPLPLYALLLLVTLAALGGIVRALKRCVHLRGCDPVWTFNVGSVVWFVGVNLLSTLQPDWYPQGRYLFPALLPILGVGIEGLRSWFSPQQRERVLPAWLIGGALVLTLVSFGVVIRGMY